MSQENQTTEVEEAEVKDEKALAEFGWDDSDDFFGIKGTGATDILEEAKEEVTEEVKEKETKVEKVKEVEAKAEEEEDPDMVPFKEAVAEQEAETDGQTFTAAPSEVDTFTNLTKDLIDRKVLNYELEEDAEINEEKFFELQTQEIETRVEEAVEAFAQGFDDEGAAFIRFKKDGGTLAEFLKVYGDSSAYPQNIDLTDENDQDKLLRYALKHYENLDNEDIDDRIEWLEEKGKKVAVASKYEDRLKKEEVQNKAKLLEAKKADAAAAEVKRKDAQKVLRTSIMEAEKIKSFPITKADKEQLFNYMTKPTVKISKGNYLTEMQSDLQSVFANEDNKLILLAKLLKDDFDVKDFKKEVITEETKVIKSRLKKAVARPKADRNSGSSKSLADFFN